jgi:taurine dioxygenase
LLFYTGGMADISIVPTTAIIGAEIRGIDLAQPLEAAEIRAIEEALYEHLVLFFPDQKISPAEHIAFSKQFGEIQAAPFGPKHPDFPAITVLDQVNPSGQGADRWHTDNTYMPNPPMGSILRGVQLPSVGGDTCFASTIAAYEALSPEMQRFADGLRAEHDLTRTLSRAIRDGHSDALLSTMQREWPPTEHPVVRTHPKSGRKCLFVNGNFTTRITNLSEEESNTVLPFLIEHVRSPAFQCRFRWEEDALVFWDNRVVQHYGVPDYTERRIMHRVTLDGDRPF